MRCPNRPWQWRVRRWRRRGVWRLMAMTASGRLIQRVQWSMDPLLCSCFRGIDASLSARAPDLQPESRP
jgi:hypothetical protein